jgi:uncharacterized protein
MPRSVLVTRLLLAGVALFACSRAATEQPTHPDPEPAPVQLSWCDSGVFSIQTGGHEVGREEFRVDCRDRHNILVYAHSSMTLPIRGDVEIHLSLDSLLQPRHVDVFGLVGGVQVADTLEWRGDSVVRSRNGQRSTIAAMRSASFVGANFHTGVWLGAARYDLRKAGDQAIPVFPQLVMRAELAQEREKSDTDSSSRVSEPDLRLLRLQLGGQPIQAWFNEYGRVIALVYPGQSLEVLRTDNDLRPAVATFRTQPDKAIPLKAEAESIPGVSAKEVKVQAGVVELAGTLTIPSHQRPVPAVILISGSGSQDRDGRIAIPGLEHYRPFRDIAQALAQKGIAVLRLDDRGIGGSETGSGAFTTWTVVQDVKAALAALRGRRDIDASRIGLLGHSEGGLVAMMVAAEDSQVAAIATLAAPAVRGDTLLRYQLEEELAAAPQRDASWSDSVRTAQQRMFDSLKVHGPTGGSAEWLRVYLTLEPAQYARKVRSPILLLQGSRDHQVPPSQARTLAAILRSRPGADVTIAILEGLNHLFLPAQTGKVAEYSHLPVQTLDPGLLTLIASWFGQRLNPSGVAAELEGTQQ